MPDDTPATETITLTSPGAIPGIPGWHGPGSYIVDWEARTITPVAPETPEEPSTEEASA